MMSEFIILIFLINFKPLLSQLTKPRIYNLLLNLFYLVQFILQQNLFLINVNLIINLSFKLFLYLLPFIFPIIKPFNLLLQLQE